MKKEAIISALCPGGRWLKTTHYPRRAMKGGTQGNREWPYS